MPRMDTLETLRDAGTEDIGAEAAIRAVWPRRTWVFSSIAPESVEALKTALSISRPLASALVARGYDTAESAAAMLAPKLSRLVAPERFPGLTRAVERIRAAVRTGEPILVFGDFDCDGLTATTVLVTALEAIGAHVAAFIPDRRTEGYGFTEAAIERALREHPATRLVVTVDCGITQEAGCALCRARGIDVILTDHHTPSEKIPSVHAIVHPQRTGVPTEARALAGVGVAFKLAHALSRGAGGERLFRPEELLPFVALGTVADIVPLTGENRILVAAGLALLNRGCAPGLQALRAASRIRGPVRSSDLGFRLGPRINAAGRIGDPLDALRLLRAKSEREAAPFAQKLDALNADRQSLERAAADEAMADLALSLTPASRSAVVTSETWNPGVLGLVAGRMSQRLGLPSIAFLVDRESGTMRGSARCPEREGLDLMALLGACAGEIRQYGGHVAAAGLTVALDRADAFRAAFEAACAAALPDGPARPPLAIDAWVDPAVVTLDFHNALSALEPTGAANPAPHWAIHAAELTCEPIAFGREGQHRRLLFRREGDAPLEAVFFNAGDLPMPWKAGDRLDIAFGTDISDFAGGSLSILVEDIRPA